MQVCTPRRQPRQHPTTLFFTGRMPFLTPNQQRQSTEGNQGDNFTTNLLHLHFAGERIFGIREHLARLQTKYMTLSRTLFALHFHA